MVWKTTRLNGYHAGSIKIYEYCSWKWAGKTTGNLGYGAEKGIVSHRGIFCLGTGLSVGMDFTSVCVPISITFYNLLVNGGSMFSGILVLKLQKPGWILGLGILIFGHGLKIYDAMRKSA